MGQGVWLDSEKLGPSDEVGEVLKHGTLSIGFIGLAETLISLYGHHHGESDAMQEKGLAIVQYMRQYLDARSERTHMNYSLLATPAEVFPAVLYAWTKSATADSRRDGQGLLHQFFPYPCVLQYLGL